MEALHPDHLKRDDMVGPWRIIQVLGRGGSSRVFKVERDGNPYTLKMALSPLSASREELSEARYVEEKSVYRRLAREAATLFLYSSHSNLLRVHAVDCWKGYPFLVIDYVDGDTWHPWRWRTRPHAARLTDAFSEVVRTVGVLHKRGVFHRDLKADNILIRREDGRPFLIDFGTVHLPGALTRTLLQALEEASGNERNSPAWKVPLTPEGPAEASLEEEERLAREEVPPMRRRTWRVGHLAGVCLLLLVVLFLASWLARSTLRSPHLSEPTASVTLEKGSAPMPPPQHVPGIGPSPWQFKPRVPRRLAVHRHRPGLPRRPGETKARELPHGSHGGHVQGVAIQDGQPAECPRRCPPAWRDG